MIQTLSRADLGRFDIGFDGKFRYHIYDPDAASVATIYNYQFLPLNFIPTILRDPSNAVAGFYVGRNRRYDLDIGESEAFVFDEYSDDFTAIYRLTGSKKVVSFLTPISGADTDKETDRYRAGMGHGVGDNPQPVIQRGLLIQYSVSLISNGDILVVFPIRCQ